MREGLAGWRLEEAWTAAAHVTRMEALPAPRAPGSGEAGSHLERDPAAAETAARKFLRANGDDSDALYVLGAALRRQGRNHEARAILEPLAGTQPQMAAVWHQLGLALARLGERAKAIESLLRAIDLENFDRASWLALADILAFQGKAEENAAERFRYIAMQLVRRDVHGLLAQIDELLESDPASSPCRLLKALALFLGRQFVAAIVEFETLLDGRDPRPGLWLALARALRALKNKRAIAAYTEAIRLVPGFSKAWVSLANASAFAPDENFIAQARVQLARPGLPAEDRARFHYVLGRTCETLKRYPESFANYARSNELLRGSAKSGVGKSDSYLERAKSVFTPAFFHARAGFGCPAAAPVFIVGMPRSGSTLVEQILSSHSQVEALGELFDLTETGRRLIPDRARDRERRYPGVLESLDAARLSLVGEEYMKATARRRVLETPFFTDKMPGNYIHAGLIQLALPNAKIIDVRRHPLDCGFSCFKNYFPAGMPDAMDLADIGHVYVNYVELMAHFDEVLPGRAHRIVYEQLIGDFEREVRRLLAHLGLPFEDACLRFHENARVAPTLSADQVGKPLYTTGIGHWRHYEQWLDPLKRELGYVLEEYPAVPKFYPRLHVRSKGARNLGNTGRRYQFVKGLRQLPFDAA